jgi:hypothetical protein
MLTVIKTIKQKRSKTNSFFIFYIKDVSIFTPYLELYPLKLKIKIEKYLHFSIYTILRGITKELNMSNDIYQDDLSLNGTRK